MIRMICCSTFITVNWINLVIDLRITLSQIMRKMSTKNAQDVLKDFEKQSKRDIVIHFGMVL